VSANGFAIYQDVIGPSDCHALTEALSKAVQDGRAGARHLLQDPAVSRIARDESLLGIARSALGRDALPFRATLFAKSRQANWLVVWHQDTALPLEKHIASPEWGPWSIKAGILYAHAPASALGRIVALRLHLDDTTRDNGPLRVIPGSHTHGVLRDDAVFELVRQTSPVDCLVRRGGVVAMRPLLIHSSSKSASPDPRRVLHIEYSDALELDRGVRLTLA
jgi:ectoine hydroxylase-related dioxygenase (phytanoyl-CoA dioxygenase family)